jgi:hypothetical protein
LCTKYTDDTWRAIARKQPSTRVDPNFILFLVPSLLSEELASEVGFEAVFDGLVDNGQV